IERSLVCAFPHQQRRALVVRLRVVRFVLQRQAVDLKRFLQSLWIIGRVFLIEPSEIQVRSDGFSLAGYSPTEAALRRRVVPLRRLNTAQQIVEAGVRGKLLRGFIE